MIFFDPDISFFPSNVSKIYHTILIYKLAQVLTSF